MPHISGITLSTNRLKEAWEQTSQSPHLINTSLIEYGEKSEKWKALVFFSNVDQIWILLIWEKARPIRNSIRHELLRQIS